MIKPTYDELLAVVKQIASFVYDGDQINGEEEHEMSIDDAFDTCALCKGLTRMCLGTDGSDAIKATQIIEVAAMRSKRHK